MGGIWTAVLDGGLLLAAYLVSRHGFRQPAGWPRAFAAALLGLTWLAVGMETLGAFGLMGRWPLLGWVAAGVVVGLACRVARRTGLEKGLTEQRRQNSGWSWEEIVAATLLAWSAAVLGAQSMLLPVKVMTDGPIYHLYFAARWWKSGRLELVASPFGENAATYFPALGDLWFSWLMIGWGGDRLAKIGQVPFLVLSGLIVYALCRRLDSGRTASFVAATWFVTCTPYYVVSFEANVDTIFVAAYLLAAYFFLRYALGDDGPAALVVGALGAGAAVAVKAPGIVFVPPLIAMGVALAAWRGCGIGGKVRGVLTVLIVPLIPAGFWWGRNWLLTGNPLYPLHLEAFGRVWLAGWYGPDVMRLSPYYIPAGDWRSFVDVMMDVIDPRLAPVWLAALAGLWAVGNRERSAQDRWVWAASALAVFNVALFWLLVPYRTQYRFMYHALGLATVPLARTLDRNRVWRLLGAGLLALHMVTGGGWPFDEDNPPWDLNPRIPNNIPPPLSALPSALGRLRAVAEDPTNVVPIALTLLPGAAATVAVLALSHAAERPTAWKRAQASMAAVALFAVTGALVYPWGASAREAFFPRFRDYYRGWLALDARSGPSGAKVAYAGTDLPYFLMGTGLRNEVRYVNVDAHPDWLLHDYHLAARADRSQPATWPEPRPGWDRVHLDYSAWLANLRAEGVQLLVVTRANPAQGSHNVADLQGFPVERGWADAHPEVFEPLYGELEQDPLFRLYRVRSRVRDESRRPGRGGT